MTYYRYIPGWNDLRGDQKTALLECRFLCGLSFIGDEKQQIIDTVRYYRDTCGADIDMPHEDCMVPLEEISIPCYLPGSAPSHCIRATVLEDVVLEVNADSFHTIQEQAFLYQTHRLGNLCKFVPNHNSIVLLPERVMQAMCAYDWKQHKAQVDEWLRMLDAAHRQMEQNPVNDLGQRVRNHGADGIIVDDGGIIIVKKKRTLH